MIRSSLREEIQASADEALAFALRHDFAGPDPYDGLLSPIAAHLPGPKARQLLVQANKRGGAISRAILRVPPVRMGKTLALFSLAAGLQGDEQLAQRLVDTLLAESDGGPWGYEFDVQTRWSYYPKGVPNVVATAFALRAIDAAGRINDVSARTSEWLNSLYDARGYFHYTPTSDSLIHNGSLLAAEALTRLGYSSTYCQTAIDTTVAHQAPGGAWAYGSSESLAWRDSFHTVYVLDSLQYLGQRGFNIGEAYEAGRRYWLDHFFLPDGRATYFADGKRPSNDVHNLATVAGALIRHKVDGHHAHLQDRVYAQLMARQGRDGGYRNSSTSQAFLRWNQGHAYLALALGAQDEE